MDLDQAIDILAAFERHQVKYVLVGSLAMAVHGIVRATQDVDFVVAADPENVERIKSALHSIFNDPSIQEIASSDLAGRYPVIRYGPPDTAFVIDLIARLGDAFAFEEVEREELSLEGVTVRVATPRMLYRMKQGTMRVQDQADAERLRRQFGLEQER